MSRLHTLIGLAVLTLLTPATRGEPSETPEPQAFPLPEPVQITTRFSFESSPAVNREGKLLAFVSDTSGNSDIWLLDLEDQELRQLTTHTADDYNPAWSADGASIYFTSTRDDPEGEIYYYSIELGFARRLTNHRGRDETPEPTNDGKFIYFTRSEPGDYSPPPTSVAADWNPPPNMTNVFRVEHNGEGLRRVTEAGGANPTLSPDGLWLCYVLPGMDKTALVAQRLADGETRTLVSEGSIVVRPRWRPEGILFTRYALDTNSDGALDTRDNAQLCLLEKGPLERILKQEASGAAAADRMKSGQVAYRRLTSGAHWDGFADTDGATVYFSSDRSSNADIWNMPLARSEMPGNPSTAFRLARGIVDDPVDRLLAFTVFVDTYYSNDELAARAQLEMASTMENLGWSRQAGLERGGVIRRWPGGIAAGAHSALSKLQQAWLEAVYFSKLPAAYRHQDEGRTVEEITPELLARARDLAVETVEHVPEVACGSLVLAGDVLYRAERVEEALESYETAARLGSDFSLRAEADFKAARSLERLGRQGEARERYLFILMNYPAEKRWQNLTQRDLVNLTVGSRRDVERIVVLEEMTYDYTDYPELAGYAQVEIGDELRRMGQDEEAIVAYRRVLDEYPRASFLGVSVLFKIAGLEKELGRPEEAAGALERVVDEYGELSGGLEAIRASQMLRRLLLEEAESYRLRNDFQRAEALIRRAMDFDYENDRVHHALVKLYCEDLGKRGDITREYRNRLRDRPDDAIAHYALGLALTYPAEGSGNRVNYGGFPAAEDELRQAVDLRFNFPAAWFSLGWIELERAVQERGEGNEREAGDLLEGALDYLRVARAQNDELELPDFEADIELLLGNGNYLLYNFGPAYGHFQRREELMTSNRAPEVEARYHFNAGRCARHTEDYPEALRHYESARQLFAELGNDVGVLMCTDAVALVHFEQEQYDKALNSFIRVAELYNQVAAREEAAAADIKDLAERTRAAERALVARAKRSYALRNIGVCYYFLQLYADALDYLQQALDVLEQLGRARFSASASGLLDFSFSAGLVGDASEAAEGFDLTGEKELIYTFAAKCHAQRGDYPAAIACYERRLALYEQKAREKDEEVAAAERGRIFNRIGYLSYQLGDLEGSAKSYLSSLEDCLAGNAYRGVLVALSNLAEITLNIADRARMEGVPTEELFPAWDADDGPVELRETALEIQRAFEEYAPKLYSVADPDLGARVANARGLLHLYLEGENETPAERYERLRRAEASFFTAQSVYETLGDAAGAVACEHNRGVALAQLGYAQSENLLQRARDRANLFALDRLSWRASRSLAELYLSRGETGRAEVYLEQALETVEREIGQRTQPVPLSVTFAEIRELYEKAVALLADEGDAEGALQLVDRQQQAYLASLFADRELELASEIDKLFLGDELFTQERITSISRTISANSLSGDPAVIEKVEGLRRKLVDERLHYREIIEEQRRRKPILTALVGVYPIGLEGAREALREEEVLLTCFFVGDGLYLWLLSGEGVRQARVDLDRTRARNLVERSLADDPEALAELGRLVLSPFSDEVREGRTLYVAPDGALWRAPWPALTLNDGAQLVETTPVATVASLSELAYCYGARNASYSKPLFFVGREGVPDWARLAAEERSAAVDGEMIPPELTERELVETITSRSHLDITAPLEFTGGDPLSFGFRLYHEDPGRLTGRGGGILNFNALLGNTLDINVVSLNDAGSRIDLDPGTGRGLAVLSRCFTYAGVPSLIFSPEDAESGARSLFAEAFARWRLSEPPAEAVRLAQLEVRRRFPSIKDWAGPELIGFAGFSDVEARTFAEEQFSNTVRSALAYQEEGNYETAVYQFLKAAGMAERLGDEEKKLQLWGAAVSAAHGSGKLKLALEYQQRLLAVAGDPASRAKAFRRLSAIKAEMGDLEGALAGNGGYLESLAELGGPEVTALTDPYLLGHLERARLLVRMYRFEEAAEEYHLTADLATGDEREATRAQVQLELGNLFQANLDDQDRAMEYAELSRRTFANLGDPVGESRALALLGFIATDAGEVSTARAYHVEGLSKAQMYPNEPDAPTARLDNLFGLAKAYWRDRSYRESAQISRSVLDELGEEGAPGLVARFLGSEALSLLGMRRPSEALTAATAALERAEATGDAREIAAAHSNLGLVYRLSGRLGIARVHFEEALKLDERIGYSQGVHNDLRHLAAVAELEGKTAEAVDFHERYLVGADPGNPRTIMGYYDVARLVLTEDPVKATDYLVRAYKGAVATGRPDLLWRVHHQRSRLAASQDIGGSRQTAVDEFNRALEIIRYAKPESPLVAAHQGIFVGPKELFTDGIELYYRAGDYERCLELLETCHSVIGGRTLAAADIPWRDRELGEALDGFLEVSHRISFLLGAERSEELAAAQAEHDAVVDEIVRRWPAFTGVVGETVTAAEVVSGLGNDRAALAYHLSGERFFAFLVSREGVEVVEGPADAVRGSARELTDLFTSHGDPDRFDELSRALADGIVEPWTERLNRIGVEELLIIPDAELSYVPFAVLPYGNGCLLDGFALAYAPSFTDWLSHTNRAYGDLPLVSFANPTTGDPKDELPFAEKEADSIAGLFPGGPEPLVGEEALEERYYELAERARRLHLATHTLLAPGDPLSSALLLTPAGGEGSVIPASEDGRLTVREILSMPLECELAVLSACETAVTEAGDGLEFLSLARAFLYAGADAVAATFWRTSDIATAIIARNLFLNLADGLTPAEALRRAQLSTRESFPSPAYWGGFGVFTRRPATER
jgi:CHAT domain-containing protein/tetratricopeptide (TPR) repeat protein